MKRRVQLCLDSGGEHFQHLLLCLTENYSYSIVSIGTPENNLFKYREMTAGLPSFTPR
jgi:hypothetical protein